MERQFDITIEIATDIEGKYTGNFRWGSSPKNILEMIRHQIWQWAAHSQYISSQHPKKYKPGNIE